MQIFVTNLINGDSRVIKITSETDFKSVADLALAKTGLSVGSPITWNHNGNRMVGTFSWIAKNLKLHDMDSLTFRIGLLGGSREPLLNP